MRVLVTGATGFLGSRLCALFARQGHSVTAFRRPSSRAAALSGLPVSEAIGDVTDLGSVERAVARQDAVVHAAADLRYGLPEEASRAQARVNVEGTRNVAQACRTRGVSRLVHVSSMAAIGLPPDAEHPADETFRFNLHGLGLRYHVSKWEAEQAIGEEAARGLDAVIVNPGGIWGRFGARYRGSELVRKVRSNRVVFYYRGGTNVVHVDDVADGISRAMESGTSGKRYILGGENLTVERMARTAADCLGVERVLLPIPTPVVSLAHAVLAPISRLTGVRPRVTREIRLFSGRYQYYDSSRAESELGFRPRPFREIAADCVSFLESSPEAA